MAFKLAFTSAFAAAATVGALTVNITNVTSMDAVSEEADLTALAPEPVPEPESVALPAGLQHSEPAPESEHAEPASAGDEVSEVDESGAQDNEDELMWDILETPLDEDVDAQGSQCQQKLVQKLKKKLGSKCIDAYPEMCSTLDQAMKAYLRKGGKRAAKKTVCRHQKDFKRALEEREKDNVDICDDLFHKAGNFGVHLPKNYGDFKRECR